MWKWNVECGNSERREVTTEAEARGEMSRIVRVVEGVDAKNLVMARPMPESPPVAVLENWGGEWKEGEGYQLRLWISLRVGSSPYLPMNPSFSSSISVSEISFLLATSFASATN